MNTITFRFLQVQEDLGGAVRGASAGPNEKPAVVADQHTSGRERAAAEPGSPSGTAGPKRRRHTSTLRPGTVHQLCPGAAGPLLPPGPPDCRGL